MSFSRFFLLIAGVALLAETVLVAAQKPAQRRIRPIVRPVPVRSQFKLRVQKTSRFAKQARPKASQPVSQNGLSVRIQPEKKEFAGNGPIAFEVTLTNTSKQTLMLFAAGTLGRTPKLVVANLKNANQWSITGKALVKPSSGKSIVLKAGKSLKYTVVVEASFVFPRPFPRPIPLPRPRLRLRRLGKAQAQAVVLKKGDRRVIGRPIIIRPIRPPIVAVPLMPCGQGPCRTRLLLEFVANPAKNVRFAFPHWTGKIATGTVDFQVGKPQPIFAPGRVLTKAQAIRIAHPIAERAMQSAYRPLANLRPPKVGPWIESPEKTATVKKTKTGGWSVGWTHFPKSGFNYNVTIDVSARGGASVREVFTGYSKR